MSKKNSPSERLFNGLVKENPTFVLTLGMCPTLAVTTSAVNGLGMGLTTMVVLAFSNMIISALRKIIPDKVRIPAFIVIAASLVTMMQLLLQDVYKRQVVTGKVARMTDFGAFVELEPGIDALLHVSQISKEHVEKPSDVLKVGEEITAKVVDFNEDDKKISLSIKALQVPEKKEEPEEDADVVSVDIDQVIADQDAE